MKTVEIALYDFDELSEKVQQKVIERFREGNQDFFWQEEWEKGLEVFCNIFNIKIHSWAISYRKHINFGIDYDDDIQQLCGVRAVSWFWNNGYQKCMKGKCFWKGNKLRKSKILLEIGDCPLTGFCGDYDILKPLVDFMKKPNSSTVYEVLESCLESWLNGIEADYESTLEDEYIIERLSEYEFTEKGEIYG